MLSKHAAAYFLSHGGPALIGFLSIAVYSSLLSPAEYGIYATIVALAAMMNSVVFEWLRLSLLRFYPKYSSSENLLETVKLSFIGLLLLTLIIGTGTSFFMPVFDIPAYFIIFILLLSWTQSWNNLNLSLMRAKLEPKAYGIIAFTRAILGLIIGSLLIMVGWGEIGLVMGIVIGFWVALLPPTLKYWKFHLKPSLFDKEITKIFVKYGTPLTVTLLLGVIIHNSDRLIIQYLLSSSETGIYSVTYDLTEQSIFTLMMIVNLAAFPIAIKMMEEKGDLAAYEQVKNNMSLLFLIALPAAGGFIAIAPNIVYLILGEDFREQALILVPFIVVGALLKGFKFYGVDVMFHIKQRTRLQMYPIGIAAAVNIILNFIFIPEFGIIGAAYSTVIAYALSIVISWFLVNIQIHRLPFPLLDFMKTISATVVMALCLWPFRENLGIFSIFFQLILGGFVFGTLTLLLNTYNVRNIAFNLITRK